VGWTDVTQMRDKRQAAVGDTTCVQLCDWLMNVNFSRTAVLQRVGQSVGWLVG
jgi:hypothetical protein